VAKSDVGAWYLYVSYMWSDRSCIGDQVWIFTLRLYSSYQEGKVLVIDYFIAEGSLLSKWWAEGLEHRVCGNLGLADKLGIRDQRREWTNMF